MIALDFMISDESNIFLSNNNGIILKECSSLEEGKLLDYFYLNQLDDFTKKLKQFSILL